MIEFIRVCDQLAPNSPEAAEIYNNLKPGESIRFTVVKAANSDRATLSQNHAIHEWCDRVAEVLNAAGKDQRVVLKESISIPWEGKDIRKKLWHPVQLALIGEASTTKATKKSVGYTYEYLHKHFSEAHEITLPEFPSRWAA